MPATGPNVNMDREFSCPGLVSVCKRVLLSLVNAVDHLTLATVFWSSSIRLFIENMGLQKLIPLQI